MTLWKILNVKSLQINKLRNDPLQTEIRSPNDTQLDSIIEFGKMALNMACSQVNRKKQLSHNTTTAIHQTCNGIVSLHRHLLATSHKYVLLGQFSTDPLAKEFGRVHQESDGTYFIDVQQCIEKLHIKQTSLLLNQNVNIDEFDVNPGHQYTSFDYKLCEEGSEIFDNMENLESSLSNKMKMALVYIPGCITRNDNQPSECETHFYNEKYGKYTNLTDCGKLRVPSDHTCQW